MGGSTLRIFHISDLHERGSRKPTERWRRYRVLGDAWRSHLSRVRQLGPIDLVCFTGDTADWGLEEEFTTATPFFEAVMNILGVPRDRFFVVPGNHDIHRPTHKSAWQRLRKQAAEADPEVLSGWLKGEKVRGLTDLQRERVLQRQESYRKWLKDLGRPELLPGALHPHLGYRQTLKLPDLPCPVQVIGLDSAWLCGDDHDAGRLFLTRDQVGLLCTQLSGELLPGFRLVLMHHPFHELADGNASWRLLGDFQVDLVLRGHLHDAELKSTSDPNRDLEEWAAGCLYEGNEGDRHPNGCTLLELDLDGEGRILDRAVHLYSWSTEGGHWFSDQGKYRTTGRQQETASELRETVSSATPANAASPTGTMDIFKPYLAWAQDRYRYLHLVGVGAGEVKLELSQVYVPLELVPRDEDMALLDSPGQHIGFDHTRKPVNQVVEVRELFLSLATDRPHVLILGDPGAGKTTSLYKLHQQCLEEGPASLGLAEGTLPIFCRLRRFTAADLGKDLEEVLGRELRADSADVLSEDIGQQLWRRGNLLLLLDGLDEISDPDLRAKVADRIEWSVSRARHRGICAVISCRKSGYEGAVQLSPSFLPVAIRPLDTEKGQELVRRWFQEVPKALPRVSETQAQEAATHLRAALAGETYASQRLKVLVGSPLLLTLLCVVVLRGREMPKHRGAFYDECLRVLLTRWSEKERERVPPLDYEGFLSVLRPVAFSLHMAGEEDLPALQLLIKIRESGQGADPFEVLEWLHKEAGVLEIFGKRYGFGHRGLREYLTALYLEEKGERHLDLLVKHFGEEWWWEVTLLLVGIPGGAASTSLFRKLLASDALLEQSQRLRECLGEAPQVDLEPFLEILDGTDPVRQAAVLRLLKGRQDPELLRWARALSGSEDAEVAAQALQRVAEAAGETSYKWDFFLLHHTRDVKLAEELANWLVGRGFQVWLRQSEEDWISVAKKLRFTQAVCVLSGPAGPAWEEDEEALDCLGLAATDQRAVRLVVLPGSEVKDLPPAWPEPWADVEWLDYRAGLGQAETRDFVTVSVGTPRVEAAAGSLSRSPGEAVPRGDRSFREPLTGTRFLWVPAGSFKMGGAVYPAEQPIHQVRISGFWLGEVPVTNRQYAHFIEGVRAQEPAYWRDRRFSDPEQPVVGISWPEAMAYCQWLTEGSAEGHRYTLPSEAQWEYAARGEESREYPWGSATPDKTLACFSEDFSRGRPAAVGSFPRGAGPFGHLDMAGTVFEWCLDQYDERAYAKRAGHKVVDPFVEHEDPDTWPNKRGGAWCYPAERLRSASRSTDPAKERNYMIGFRVAVAAPNLPKP